MDYLGSMRTQGQDLAGQLPWMKRGGQTGMGFGTSDLSPTTRGAAGFGAQGQPMNPYLSALRNQLLRDAAARTRGARLGARSQAFGDPSLSAYADVSSLIGGQGDAANQYGRAMLQWMQDQANRQWQEKMLRLRAQLEEQAQRRASAGGWLGSLGSAAGLATGGWLGGRR